jgi:RNA polymerase sigma-70 factor (ECF subfamily)
MSDAQDDLATRVQQGDRDALVAFIECRKLELLAFVNRSLSDRLRRKVDPQDIIQEMTLSALDLLSQGASPNRDPFGWLCQLAERRIIDAHRRHIGAQKRSADREVAISAPAGEAQGGLIDLLVASMTSPSRAFSRGQKEFFLLEALESLPDESREAIRLRYVENVPTKEIADRLGKTDGAVRVLLSRSLSRLQTLLASNSAFESFQSPG